MKYELCWTHSGLRFGVIICLIKAILLAFLNHSSSEWSGRKAVPSLHIILMGKKKFSAVKMYMKYELCRKNGWLHDSVITYSIEIVFQSVVTI